MRMVNGVPTVDKYDMASEVRWDEQGRPYKLLGDGTKMYMSPNSMMSDDPNSQGNQWAQTMQKPDGGFWSSPEWDDKTGEWASSLNGGNILAAGLGGLAGGEVLYPMLAGAGGATGAGAGVEAGSGGVLPSTSFGIETGVLPSVSASGAVPAALGTGAGIESVGTMAGGLGQGAGEGVSDAGTFGSYGADGSAFGEDGSFLGETTINGGPMPGVGEAGALTPGMSPTTGAATSWKGKLLDGITSKEGIAAGIQGGLGFLGSYLQAKAQEEASKRQDAFNRALQFMNTTQMNPVAQQEDLFHAAGLKAAADHGPVRLGQHKDYDLSQATPFLSNEALRYATNRFNQGANRIADPNAPPIDPYDSTQSGFGPDPGANYRNGLVNQVVPQRQPPKSNFGDYFNRFTNQG